MSRVRGLNVLSKYGKRDEAFLKSLSLSNEQVKEVRKYFDKRSNATVMKAILVGAVAATSGIYLSDYQWKKEMARFRDSTINKQHESVPTDH